MEELLEEMGVVKVGGRGAVEVRQDIRTKIAALERQVREYEQRMASAVAGESQRTREAEQLSFQLKAAQQTNEMLTQRLFEANDRLKRAGSLVGGVVADQPRINAAVRLADAVVAITKDLTGEGPVLGLGARAEMSREHEAAYRDYVYERGRDR
jgi:hypothetical protein